MNNNYKKLNILTGWLVFVIAATTYLLTIEPTTSFWDCGEFIASAHKLEVGHPPGAPLFMIAAKVFSLFSGGNNAKVAVMINSLSALASAFTILFLFWTITYFAQKLILIKQPVTKNNKKTGINLTEKPDNQYTTYDKITILATGVVGALAYTFSDTFWFSAVEGEVYAMSSLFTAIVFWAILKWEKISDQKYSNRWLIFIAYMMGLSIGVHLLNLLAIPAIVFVYYFKNYKTSRKGIIKASIAAVVILAAIMYGIIPGVVKIASWFELLFVNSFGMTYNSGVIFYIVGLTTAIVLGIVYTIKKNKVVANTIITSFTVILIGYSSFTMIVIRSIADTPMNENKPDNVFSLLSYLNREQYGNRPLFYGQYFNAPITSQKTKYTYTKKNGKYEKIPVTNPTYIYESGYNTIFPRIYSHQSNHEAGYKNWLNISNTKKKPGFFSDNLAFFFSYQLNHMYIRYFMWNFAGRQNDYQGHGGILKGNWISGIPFLDEIRLGNQDNLPESLKNNKARNKYYLFPLLLGIFGLLFMLKKRPQQFTVVLLLFFFTGIAIVMYLNQTPYQPRERDYAYAGSFYAFAIWIGIGVIAISERLKSLLPNKNLSIIITFTLTFILVPCIMAHQNWDDHDRSGRYTTRDFSKAYLDSCEPNAILFTYGDNDTFPLWYVQEVEGYRTDVRVVNLSLLGTDWYIDQMKKQAYESKPVPFSLEHKHYEQGIRDIIPISNRIEQYVLLKEIIGFVSSDDRRTKVEVGGAGSERELMNYLPANKFFVNVDTAKVIRSGLAANSMIDCVLSSIEFTVQKKYITKSDMMVLDLIANFNWDRPIYFAIGVGEENFMGLQNYFQLEGFAYKLVPYYTNDSNKIGYVDTDILYENLMNKFKWGNMEKPDVLIENYNIRVFRTIEARNVFYRLADALINENKNSKAEKVLDKILKLSPNDKIPYDFFMLPIAESYYRIGKIDKANNIIHKMFEIYENNVKYYFGLGDRFAASIAYESKVGISILQRLVELTETYKQKELNKQINSRFNILAQKYMSKFEN